jgi:hypothetical protein
MLPKMSRPFACRCTISIPLSAGRFHPTSPCLAGSHENVVHRVGLFIAALAEDFVKHGKARQERDRGRVSRPARRLSQGSFFAEDLKSRRQPLRGDDGRGDLCPDESHRDDVFSDARDDKTV